MPRRARFVAVRARSATRSLARNVPALVKQGVTERVFRDRRGDDSDVTLADWQLPTRTFLRSTQRPEARGRGQAGLADSRMKIEIER
jgi:hypothetical protein